MIALEVNGTTHNVDAPPDMPLLWVLRDTLGLTGTKFGCGLGSGDARAGRRAVHVHRAGAALTKAAAGKQIVTIEGLSPDTSHPLQVAWVAEQVPQCGYCQSGQIMAAAALLAKTPTPTDAQIDTAMTGNICRCGTYQRIRAAIKQASKEQA